MGFEGMRVPATWAPQAAWCGGARNPFWDMAKMQEETENNSFGFSVTYLRRSAKAKSFLPSFLPPLVDPALVGSGLSRPTATTTATTASIARTAKSLKSHFPVPPPLPSAPLPFALVAAAGAEMRPLNLVSNFPS